MHLSALRKSREGWLLLSTKMWRFMKLVIVIMLAAALHVSASGYAQKVTYSGKNVYLPEIFTSIRQQTGYVIFCDYALLKASKPVTIMVKNEPLESFLQQVLRDQALSYYMENTTIFINPQPIAPASPLQPVLTQYISGTVTDSLGVPIAGANVRLQPVNKMMQTNEKGEFLFQGLQSGDYTLEISFVGHQTVKKTVVLAATAPSELGVLVLRPSVSALEGVNVISNGYQLLAKERATGSFSYVGEELINRRVSGNILSRLNGVVDGLYYIPNFSGENTIRIRGESTLYSSVLRSPLIILDNFPYEGNLNNINPNDVASVTILKDAAAASIWGAKSGNGVIVITTKKGKLNQPLKVELNANVTIGGKPDLFYLRNVMPANDFIGVEDLLFNAGFFDADISNTSNRPPLTPVIDIRARQRAGLITAAEAEAQIDAYRSLDVRNDILKYLHRRSVNQQYSIGLRGGGNKIAYAFSAGYDHNLQNAVRTSDQRFTINSSATFTPVKNLEITTSLNYANTRTNDNNPARYGLLYTGYYGVNSKYNSIFPYAQLADENGNALTTIRDYRAAYLDSVEALGFRDWRYRALDEVRLADKTNELNNLLLNVSARYRITPFLQASLQYQNERQITTSRDMRDQQSYAMRNLYNKFTQYDPLTQKFSYYAPDGSLLILENDVLYSSNVRGQLSYNQVLKGNHEITALAGAELKELKGSSMRNVLSGYNADNGTVNMNLNFNTSYPLTPSGSTTFANSDYAPGGADKKTLYRYVSYFANAAYTYNNLYTFTISGRKDGSNIFGVKTNQKVTPLWSAGLGWNISGESFYHSTWLPFLKLRATYGFNGNVYNGSAYPTGTYLTSSLTGESTVFNMTAGNPELSWEKIKIINTGIDFRTADNIISGTIEVYRKEGLDLLQTVTLPPQTAAGSILKNSASTRAHGIEMSLTSNNINREFKWQSGFIVNYLKDKVISYNVPFSSSSIQYNSMGIALEGKPLYSVFSYKWAGLDPANGDPQGMLNGKVSKDYGSIIANYNPDSVVYHGSTRPVLWGAFRNDFSFKGFSLSVNILYEGGYYFRRQSTSLNYSDVILSTQDQNVDYADRWQQPGDELTTNVPSLVYPSNTNRNTFYKYSAALVEKGDHIRLQDIRLGYDFTGLKKRGLPFDMLQLYSYANNVGILWRANKYNIDPASYQTNSYPIPFSISFGVKANF